MYTALEYIEETPLLKYDFCMRCREEKLACVAFYHDKVCGACIVAKTPCIPVDIVERFMHSNPPVAPNGLLPYRHNGSRASTLLIEEARKALTPSSPDPRLTVLFQNRYRPRPKSSVFSVNAPPIELLPIPSKPLEIQRQLIDKMPPDPNNDAKPRHRTWWEEEDAIRTIEVLLWGVMDGKAAERKRKSRPWFKCWVKFGRE